MRAEHLCLHGDRKVTLDAYLQETDGEFRFSRRPAMVVLPGGGYAMCSDREADPIALTYAMAGYQTFVLRYTLRDQGGWPLPLEDYDEVMALIQSREDWHVDPSRIAVVGFSAGGHLAACAATMARHRPAAAILVYPAVLPELLGFCQPGMPSPVDYVDRHTCPCFFAAARNDRMVPIKNTLAMEMALTEAGIPFESHIYSHGDHGFATGRMELCSEPVSPKLANWMEDSLSWLDCVMGRLTTHGFEDPISQAVKGADFASVLSADCSLGYLLKHEQAGTLLKFLAESLEARALQEGRAPEGYLQVLNGYSLREVLTMAQQENQIPVLDQALRSIPNF